MKFVLFLGSIIIVNGYFDEEFGGNGDMLTGKLY